MQIGCKLYGWRFIGSSGERVGVERRMFAVGGFWRCSLIENLDKKFCVVACLSRHKQNLKYGGEARIAWKPHLCDMGFDGSSRRQNRSNCRSGKATATDNGVKFDGTECWLRWGIFHGAQQILPRCEAKRGHFPRQPLNHLIKRLISTTNPRAEWKVHTWLPSRTATWNWLIIVRQYLVQRL